MINDSIPFGAEGHVIQRDADTGEVICSGHNLVVDVALEFMLQALIGRYYVAGITLGLSSTGNVSQPVTPGMRVVPNIVDTAPIANTQTFVSRDAKGLLSIVTFTANYKNISGSSISYDTLGLVSNVNSLFSATNFDKVTLQSNQTVSLQWTIFLRGRQ
jgi:hypothetical protein